MRTDRQRPLSAVEVPLLYFVEYDGQWRRLVGTKVNLTLGIVSMSFENWGGVVDFPAGAPVNVQRPE